MTTRTSKLGAELRPGDAMIFLDEPRVITAIEERVEQSVRVRVAGGGFFLIRADEPVRVEEATPGRFDGYMSEVEGGWQVASAGADLGTYADESVAATVLAQTTKRPRWKVHADGTTIRLG
jgi:hypothetical protein